ncbi:MAG: cupin domain-containing protein [Bacteroidales bacterium]|nr:cupin domain-containing protein [Bacteroidales bacterium]
MNHSVFNLFDTSSLNYSTKEEIVNLLFTSENIRIERIVSYGQISEDWYNQEENEWVFLLQGNASILFDDGNETHLKAGDSLYIPAHSKHKVSFTSTKPSCIWLAVFFN